MTNHGKRSMVNIERYDCKAFGSNGFIDDGSCNEIYMDKPPSALVGLSFKEAAWVSVKNQRKKAHYNTCLFFRWFILNVKPFCLV